MMSAEIRPNREAVRAARLGSGTLPPLQADSGPSNPPLRTATASPRTGGSPLGGRSPFEKPVQPGVAHSRRKLHEMPRTAIFRALASPAWSRPAEDPRVVVTLRLEASTA